MAELGGGVACRFCAGSDGAVVLDLGEQPAGDRFPAQDDSSADPLHPLRMWMCRGCGLAQLAEDPTTPEEPRAVEPEAMVRQARDAVARAGAAGLLPVGGTVREFGSPHGGSWLGLLAERGLREVGGAERATVVVDCIGVMHEEDQAAGLRRRVDVLAPGGVLLVEFHAFAAIVESMQWNALRHGHFAYYSVTALVEMLASVGLETTHGFWFDLYGGTVMLAARRADEPGPRDRRSVDALLAEDVRVGATEPGRASALGRAADASAQGLRRHLLDARSAGHRVLGYGAASRAVALLHRARIDVDLLPMIADASPAKHGRRMPSTSIPIRAPHEIVAQQPDEVILFVMDLLDDVRTAMPEVEAAGGRWVVVDPDVKVVEPTTVGRGGSRSA